MTFLDNEGGIESSAPREGIEIICTAVTYRIATGSRSATIDGRVFTAATASRGEVGIAMVQDSDDEVEVTIPVAHPAVQRYLANGIPPMRIYVKVWRQQYADAELIWQGWVTSLAPEGHLAKLRVPSRMNETVQRRLPTVSCGRACPHILFDNACRVDRSSFRIESTVDRKYGRTVEVIVPMDFELAKYGELEHIPSGERMTIDTHTTVLDVGGAHQILTIQAPIYELKVGDPVAIYAGCDRTLFMCRTRFANVVNYGGFPYMVTSNIFLPTGPGNNISP